MEANMRTMTQAEKTLLRYQYVMANSTAAQGDFARTSGTWANQVRILAQSFEALGAVVGGTLINAFRPLLQALNTVIGKIIQFARTVSDALGAIFAIAYEYIMLVFMCTRYLVLLLLEIVSPVAIACLYNGNTRSSFFTWAKALFGVYMMYPAFIIVSIFSDLVVKNYIMNTPWPLFIMILFSFILKTSLLGTAKSTINRWL